MSLDKTLPSKSVDKAVPDAAMDNTVPTNPRATVDAGNETLKPNGGHQQGYAALTDPGRVRKLNEDSYYANPANGLWIVADGMGGHEAGEIASRIAVKQVPQALRAGATLSDAIATAHETILQAPNSGVGTIGMGCTIVALLSTGLDYEIAWVGDSRAYLWDGDLRQITKDHSLVQEKLDAGLITEDQVRDDPNRHGITQCLGSGNTTSFMVDTLLGSWHKGEKILLCSDGLYDELSADRLSEIITTEKSNKKAVKQLVNAALEAGGNDNITAMLIEAPGSAPIQSVASAKDVVSETNAAIPAKQSRMHSFMVGIALAFLFAIVWSLLK